MKSSDPEATNCEKTANFTLHTQFSTRPVLATLHSINTGNTVTHSLTRLIPTPHTHSDEYSTRHACRLSAHLVAVAQETARLHGHRVHVASSVVHEPNLDLGLGGGEEEGRLCPRQCVQLAATGVETHRNHVLPASLELAGAVAEHSAAHPHIKHQTVCYCQTNCMYQYTYTKQCATVRQLPTL